ncbi:MAG: hypothetical protein ACRD2N_21305 [Vicinamibacterales bacterium]
MRRQFQPGSVAPVFAFFALSVVMTWPLARGLGRDVPGDLGDSLLNMWILSWGVQHVPQLLTGAMSWQDFWNANIFHPDPLALALSEHLFGQTLQVLPVYAVTGNIILCYNLLFISTFALSAWGTYLFVRDLTGDSRAAFIAGLVFGFLPYRIASLPHVQVMSAQWMPFALFGLNRFITTGSQKALAGGTAALVMQNWSCGYYLLYFAPFVPLFCLHRMWTGGRLRQLSIWIGLSVSATVTLLCTLPFLLPYAEAQQRFGFERGIGEVITYSANVWSYVTAAEPVWLWGRALRFYPHGEGETFLGFMPWLLAVVASADAFVDARRATNEPSARGWRRVAIWLLTFAVITQLIGVMSAVIFGGFDSSILGIPLRARTPIRLLAQLVLVFGLLMVISPRARAVAARLSRSQAAFFLTATILAMWLSLGPMPSAGDQRVSGIGLYGLLYDYVPGFNGVRVPARYAMIAGLFLAVLAGYGAKPLMAARHATAIVVAGSLLILVEGAALPLLVNWSWAQNEAMPPARIFPADRAPAAYRRLKSMAAGTVVTEFPFGDAAWEIRYVYYSSVHGKPITNGYSGQFPPDYKVRVARLGRVSVNPEAAWQSLKDTGTTHVLLHPGAFLNPGDAESVRSWLVRYRATLSDSFPDGDELYAIP